MSATHNGSPILPCTSSHAFNSLSRRRRLGNPVSASSIASFSNRRESVFQTLHALLLTPQIKLPLDYFNARLQALGARRLFALEQLLQRTQRVHMLTLAMADKAQQLIADAGQRRMAVRQ